jgi:chemosensory pili system protein ChpC
MAQAENIVRSQIITLNGINLVLPNTCIAEVINYTEPTPVEDAPDWYLGNILWRGIAIPIVSFETANEVPSANHSGSVRIAVLNGVSGEEKLPFYGIIIQGIPRLVTLKESDIRQKDHIDQELPLILSQVDMDDMDAVIPDQVKIEDMLTKAGAQTGGIY